MLIKEFTSSIFDKQNNMFVIQTDSKSNMLVNKQTLLLLEILKATDSYTLAHQEFCTQFNITISFEDFKKVVVKKFTNKNILIGEDVTTIKPKKYVWANFTIIPANIAGIISKPFEFLFNPVVFMWLFPTSVLSLIIASINIFFKQSTPAIHSKTLLVLFFLSAFLHEIGHITVCSRLKLKHGGIGAGIYFMFPVFYSEISCIWIANKRDRIIANLAGVYLEILFSLCLLLFSKYTAIASSAVVVIGLRSLWELYPFVRSDGYWLLSDITNTPNLLPRSAAILRKLFSFHFLKTIITNPLQIIFRSNLRTVLICIYGMLNYSIMLFYLTAFYFGNSTLIKEFPKTLISIAKEAIQRNNPIEQIRIEYLFVVIWYIVSVNIFLAIIKYSFIKIASIWEAIY